MICNLLAIVVLHDKGRVDGVPLEAHHSAHARKVSQHIVLILALETRSVQSEGS